MRFFTAQTVPFRAYAKNGVAVIRLLGGGKAESLKSLKSLKTLRSLGAQGDSPVGYLRRIFRKGSFSTPKNASPNIPPDIFDVPASRSTKIIDSSPMRKPSFHAVYFISIWNP